MDGPVVATIVLVSFLAGYLVRALISRRRHRRFGSRVY